MKKLSKKQIESLKNKIETSIPLQGLSFNSPFETSEAGIEYVVLERYSYNMKIIYVVVPLKLDEQFNRINELDRITKELCNRNDANFGFFGTCSFEGDVAMYLTPTDHQIERLK
jgi:hypothetical protein